MTTVGIQAWLARFPCHYNRNGVKRKRGKNGVGAFSGEAHLLLCKPG